MPENTYRFELGLGTACRPQNCSLCELGCPELNIIALLHPCSLEQCDWAKSRRWLRGLNVQILDLAIWWFSTCATAEAVVYVACAFWGLTADVQVGCRAGSGICYLYGNVAVVKGKAALTCWMSMRSQLYNNGVNLSLWTGDLTKFRMTPVPSLRNLYILQLQGWEGLCFSIFSSSSYSSYFL